MIRVEVSPEELELLEKNRKDVEFQEQLKHQAYLKKVDEHIKRIDKAAISIANDNKINEALYNKLLEKGVPPNVIKFEKTTRVLEEGKYYTENLKPEDIKTLEVESTRVVLFGYTLTIGQDSRVDLPSTITGSFRRYSLDGAVKKILGYIEKKKAEEETTLKRQQVKDNLTKFFLSNSPEGTIVSASESWNKAPYRGAESYTSYFLNITFPNTNSIKVAYYPDGSWSIRAHVDKGVPKDKIELFNRLKG